MRWQPPWARTETALIRFPACPILGRPPILVGRIALLIADSLGRSRVPFDAYK